MHLVKNYLISGLMLVSLIPAIPFPAHGSEQNFDAICLPEKKKCRISLSPDEIKIGLDVVIPTKRITSWDQGGKGTRPDAGMAAASVMLTPVVPIAIFGIFKSKHEYIFNIGYVNDEGIEIQKSILFKNKKPQDRFSAYLGNITGLAKGGQTSKPIELAKQNKAVGESNSFYPGISKSAIYSYSARCQMFTPYECVSLMRKWPYLTTRDE